jgi:hypothetical protein
MSTTIHWIGITGKAGHGKSTFAKQLKNEIHFFTREYESKEAWIIPFAMQLKLDVVSANNDVTFEDVFIDKPSWVRTLLQNYGAMLRARNINVWIERVENLVRAMVHESDDDTPNRTVYVILPDLRLANEFEWLRKQPKHTIVRVVSTAGGAPMTPKQAAHPSEIEQDGQAVDFELVDEARDWAGKVHAALSGRPRRATLGGVDTIVNPPYIPFKRTTNPTNTRTRRWLSRCTLPRLTRSRS